MFEHGMLYLATLIIMVGCMIFAMAIKSIRDSHMVMGNYFNKGDGNIFNLFFGIIFVGIGVVMIFQTI